MNDADLVRAVQGGDRGALTILYERYVRLVWRLFAAHVTRDQAEDLVSETFLAAIRTVGQFDPERGTVHGWLLGIARNKLRDHWRRASRSHAASRSDTIGPIADESRGPEQRLVAAETSGAVVEALESLKDSERLALEWKYMESLSIREIAERLGRTEKAVEAILYRARASFRAMFARERTRTDEA